MQDSQTRQINYCMNCSAKQIGCNSRGGFRPWNECPECHADLDNDEHELFCSQFDMDGVTSEEYVTLFLSCKEKKERTTWKQMSMQAREEL
jgi:hypothetical protein